MIMHKNSSHIDEVYRFSAHLSPHRSLTPQGFIILMTCIGSVCFIIGFIFMLAGAWPVMGFLGLDVALIYFAFRRNYQDAKIFETIDLTSDHLVLTRVYPSGQKQSWDFNPFWVRVGLTEHASGANQMKFTSHGKSLPFGAFLSNDERREFVIVLRDQLARARTALR